MKVESSVLSELVEEILKPVDTLRYMQVFEYNCPPPEVFEEEKRIAAKVR